MSKRKGRNAVVKSWKHGDPPPAQFQLEPAGELTEEERQCIRENFPGHHGNETALCAIEDKVLAAKRGFISECRWKRAYPTPAKEITDAEEILKAIGKLKERLQAGYAPLSAGFLAMRYATDNFAHPVNFRTTLDEMEAAWQHALDELGTRPDARGKNASKELRDNYIKALIDIYEEYAAPMSAADNDGYRADFVEGLLRSAGAELPQDLQRLIGKALKERASTP